MPAARAPGVYGVRWYYDTLRPHMVLFAVAFDRGMREVVDRLAGEVQQYAQDNAPWEDRSGDARAGLTATARHRLNYYYIDLYHTVDYGIWLEIRWEGRFAIIKPTLEHYGPIVMGELKMGEALLFV